jgi:DNA-3-methyladenine glycosylase
MPPVRLKPPPFSPLLRSFYEPSSADVAPKLLGHWLVRQTKNGPIGGIIVEVEAYIRNDPSAHSFRGQTKRNKVMFGPPGHSYVYLIYGFHYCVNTVCRPAGEAEAVLIRAVHPLWGLDEMSKRRKGLKDRHLASGPGKLCAAMDIDRALDGADLCVKKSPLIVAENPERAKTISEIGPIVQTTRIGITQAADWPLRWYLRGSPHVSRK